jgi:hypothetical protein
VKRKNYQYRKVPNGKYEKLGCPSPQDIDHYIAMVAAHADPDRAAFLHDSLGLNKLNMEDLVILRHLVNKSFWIRVQQKMAYLRSFGTKRRPTRGKRI